MLRYTTRPLSDRTWLRPAGTRKTSPFDTGWSNTLDLLEREVRHLSGTDLVIEVDAREQDIRNDGMLKANARPGDDAVVVAFDSTHGPLQYRADRYRARWSDHPGWQQNVRAVALTLEYLRAVDRHGATDTGQQYAGFKALGAGTAMPASHMTRDEAEAVITSVVGPMDRSQGAERYRRARVMAHPDRNEGDHALAYKVDQALRVLGVGR